MLRRNLPGRLLRNYLQRGRRRILSFRTNRSRTAPNQRRNRVASRFTVRGHHVRLGAAVALATAGVLAGCITTASSADTVSTAHTAAQPHVSFTASPSPAYAADAGDPDLLYSNGTYYAFTTGTPLGNHIQALTVEQSRVGVAALHGRYGLERAAEPSGLGDAQHPDVARRLLLRRALGHVLRRLAERPPADSGYSCISVATASTLSPPVFTDTSSRPADLRHTRGGGARPEPLRRPRHRAGLPGLEDERRRRFRGAVADRDRTS